MRPVTSLLFALLALLGLGGCSSSLTNTGGSASGLQAAALADAATMGYPYGAVLVRWPFQGARAVAYLIYRDGNPYAPVAAVDGYTTSFEDHAGPLPSLGDVMETREVSIELDEERGIISRFDSTVSYDASADDYYNADMQYDRASFSVSARRIPLEAGQTVAYQIRLLYLAYDQGDITDPIGHPAGYQLLLGAKSAMTARVTLVAPPALEAPDDGVLPAEGVYRCERVPGATTYTLQLSAGDPTFAAGRTLSVSASAEGQYALGQVSLSTLYGSSAFRNAGAIYWRMGARAAGQPAPVAAADRGQQGWVYSLPRAFVLPAAPPGAFVSLPTDIYQTPCQGR